MKTRFDLQRRIVGDLTPFALEPGSTVFAEIRTGTGKTKILLDVAQKVLETGRSVVISTANNFLAESYLAEARKFGVDESAIRFVVGKDNYLDESALLQESYLFEFGLDRGEVEAWLESHREKALISLFLNDFDLPDEAGEPIRSESNEEREIKRVAKKIVEEPAIYITNHFYLIALMRHSELEALSDATVLLDESHALHNAARTVFRQNFSLFRLRYLLFGVMESGKLSKAARKRVGAAIASIDGLMAELAAMRKTVEAGETERALALLREEAERRFLPVRKDLLALRKKSSFGDLDKAIRELGEMAAILSSGMNARSVEVSYSAAKGFPAFSVYVDNPVAVLRKSLARHAFALVGVSGTIRVSISDSVEENRWSFERIGFFRFKKAESEESLRFNRRVDALRLLVYPSVFGREQCRYHVASDKRFNPPSGELHADGAKRSYERWVDNLARLCKETAWGNTLVLMSSFENVEMMKEALEALGMGEEYAIFHHRIGTGMRQVVAEYKRSVDAGKKSLLIGGLGFYTGVDLHGDYLHTLFLGKLPIEPRGIYSRMRIGSYSVQADMRLNALLTFRQGIGRAIRSPKDRALVVVADPRIEASRYRMFKAFLDEYGVPVRS